VRFLERHFVPGKWYVGETIPGHCNELQYTEDDRNRWYLPLIHTHTNTHTHTHTHTHSHNSVLYQWIICVHTIGSDGL